MISTPRRTHSGLRARLGVRACGQGELKAQEPAVEVDGLTSDEAKTTQDFNVQFEVARHPELLAFLAMNPYLYDDMYSWLAARGEADIDEALSHNKGYQEYREAVGK